jgi:histidyl-tRNA synthetase
MAEHQISNEKGKLIKNRSHSRDRSKGIEDMKQHVINIFENPNEANLFVEEVHLRYNRYRRDQFSILLSVIRKNSALINQALSICMREKLYSANDFRDVVNYLKNTTSTKRANDSISQPTLSDYKYEVTTRSLSTYTSILGGHVQ